MKRNYPMKEHELFSDSVSEEHMRLAERELSAFIRAVTDLYGPEKANLATSDWLDELELMDGTLVSADCKWRSVTIAASARLAHRLNATGNRLNGTGNHRPSKLAGDDFS